MKQLVWASADNVGTMNTSIRSAAPQIAVPASAKPVGPHLVPHAASQVRHEISRLETVMRTARFLPGAYQMYAGEVKFLNGLFVGGNPKNALKANAGEQIVGKAAQIQHLLTVA